MHASCVFADETTLIVFCPYCSKLHKHGSGVAGPRMAHCHRGEYIVGTVFSDQFIEQAFKQHQKKLEAKRKNPRRQEKSLQTEEECQNVST